MLSNSSRKQRVPYSDAVKKLLREISKLGMGALEPPQWRGSVARGFVEMPRIPPRQGQGSGR